LVLSRIYGCVTNNKAFWIGWLDLLTLPLGSELIPIKLQQLTINLQPNSWLPRTRSLHSRCRSPLYSYSLYSSVFLQQPVSELLPCPLTIPRHGPHGKHFSSVVLECVFIGSLPNNGCPIVDSVAPGRCLPSRCLAMVIRVKIFSCHFKIRNPLHPKLFPTFGPEIPYEMQRKGTGFVC
jgi:hypothetical protein